MGSGLLPGGGLSPAPDTVFEPMTLAVHLQDADAVGEAIQEGTGESFPAGLAAHLPGAINGFQAFSRLAAFGLRRPG
jgi:hypothetical protein